MIVRGELLYIAFSIITTFNTTLYCIAIGLGLSTIGTINATLYFEMQIYMCEQ